MLSVPRRLSLEPDAYIAPPLSRPAVTPVASLRSILIVGDCRHALPPTRPASHVYEGFLLVRACALACAAQFVAIGWQNNLNIVSCGAIGTYRHATKSLLDYGW